MKGFCSTMKPQVPVVSNKLDRMVGCLFFMARRSIWMVLIFWISMMGIVYGNTGKDILVLKWQDIRPTLIRAWEFGKQMLSWANTRWKSLDASDLTSKTQICLYTIDGVGFLLPLLTKLSLSQRVNYLVIAFALPANTLSFQEIVEKKTRLTNMVENFFNIHHSVMLVLFSTLYWKRKVADPLYNLVVEFNDFGHKSNTVVLILFWYLVSILYSCVFRYTLVAIIVRLLWDYTAVVFLAHHHISRALDPYK